MQFTAVSVDLELDTTEQLAWQSATSPQKDLRRNIEVIISNP